MAVVTTSDSALPASPVIQADAVRRTQSHPRATLRFDVLSILCGLWVMIGLFLDGSAHEHHLVDSFWTPWHAVLYTGIFSNAVALFFAVTRNQRKGYSAWAAVPAGYELSAVGVIICGVGGVCDMIWHTVLGVEIDFQALLSPPHLMLAFGAFLFISGAFRSAWRRPDSITRGRFALWPMIVSLSFTFLLLTFFTFVENPFYILWPTIARGKEYGVDFTVLVGFPQMLVQTVLFMGCVLIAVRRWQLPFGSITLILGLNLLALAVIDSRTELIPMAIGAGLIADTLILILRPSIKRLIALRAFAFCVPMVLYLLYFLTIALAEGGVAWNTPFWTGATVLTGAVAVMLSYLMIPSPSLAVPPPEQVIPT